MRAILLLLTLALPCGATTYYMRADGTAANKGAATGPASTQSACMSIATYNGQTFSAGDVILLSSQGGDYTAQLSMVSSGSAGSPITFKAVSGETPKIATSSSPIIKGNGKSYLVIADLWVTNTSGTGKGFEGATSATDVTLSNLFVTINTGYYVDVAGVQTNFTVRGLRASGGNQAAIYVFGSAATNVVIRDCTMTNGAGMSFTALNNLTVSNVYLASNGAYGLQAGTCSGAYSIDGLTIDGTSSQDGINISAGAGVSSLIITNSSVISPNAIGISLMTVPNVTIANTTITNATRGIQAYTITNASILATTVRRSRNQSFFIGTNSINITLNGCMAREGLGDAFCSWDGSQTNIYISCTATNNTGDGFSTNDQYPGTTTHDIYYTNCISWGNGTKSTTTSGDGFTGHQTNWNVVLNNCLSVSNTASGCAYIQYTSGSIINCLFAYNAANWVSQGGVDQVRGGFYINTIAANPVISKAWFFTNNIGVSNYPCELSLTGPTLSTRDYNCYLPINAASKFATMDGNSTFMSWATYAASYEPNGFTNNPKFLNPPSNFRQQWIAPTINKGAAAPMAIDFDGNPVLGTRDIGPFDYQAKAVLLPCGPFRPGVR